MNSWMASSPFNSSSKSHRGRGSERLLALACIKMKSLNSRLTLIFPDTLKCRKPFFFLSGLFSLTKRDIWKMRRRKAVGVWGNGGAIILGFRNEWFRSANTLGARSLFSPRFETGMKTLSQMSRDFSGGIRTNLDRKPSARAADLSEFSRVISTRH